MPGVNKSAATACAFADDDDEAARFSRFLAKIDHSPDIG
jgi:hypothetical protein